MATIDVIIPVFNQTTLLRRCLASWLQQSWTDFTLTVVDDGSTESVAETVREISPDIRVIRQTNRGAAAARNRGARETMAPYLLFCDADITLQKNSANTLHGCLQANPKKSYAYSGFKFGRKTFRSYPFDPHRLRQMPYIHTTALLRRAHFPGFDESLKRFQDWDLWLTMLEQGHEGVWVDEVLFTVAPGGTMSRWLPKFFYPWLPWLPAVRAYRVAMAVVMQKHGLG